MSRSPPPGEGCPDEEDGGVFGKGRIPEEGFEHSGPLSGCCLEANQRQGEKIDVRKLQFNIIIIPFCISPQRQGRRAT